MTSHSSGHYPEIKSTRTRGTVATPTAIQLNDDLLRQNFFGHNGSTTINGASITVSATENWSGSNRGVSYTIGTEANGGTGIVDRIKIDGSGDITLGNFKFDGTQTVGASEDNYVLTYDNSTGKISLEASAGGGGGITHFEELAPTGKNITLDNTLTTDAIIIGNNNTMGARQNDNSVICGFNATVGTTITSGNSFVGGGLTSTIQGSYCGIIAGSTLTVTGANWSVAMGGSSNTVTASRSAVIAGQNITANEAKAVFMPQIRGIGTGTGSGTSVMKLYDSTASTVNFEVKDNGTAKSKGQIGSSAGATPNTETPTGTTETIDWNNGNYQILDLESASGNVTLTLSNPVVGFAYFLEIRQDSTTPLDVIFPSSVKFAGETAPYTLDVSTGANAVDAVSLAWNGSEYIASFSQNHG